MKVNVEVLGSGLSTYLRGGLPGMRRAPAIVLVTVAEGAAAAAAAAAHAGRRSFQEAAVRVIPAVRHRAVIAGATHGRAPHVALPDAQVRLGQQCNLRSLP